MGKSVLIYGKSGSGKSRSLKNFAPDEILLINVIGKDLPFRRKFIYTANTDNYESIVGMLSRMEQKNIKTAVIDDAGYLQTNMFMSGHSAPKRGSSAFDLYNDIADNFWRLMQVIRSLPDDVIVYLMMHEASNDNGEVKLRTIGRLLDEKVCIEGQATICLRCMTDGTRHFFRTQSDGFDISKSPEDMFEREIDNDLKMVDEKIRNYYFTEE